MELLIERIVLLEGLEKVKETVGKQVSLPILKNIKLVAQKDSLKLFTTNLNTGTIVHLKDLQIVTEGEAICDALRLLSIVKELPDKELGLKVTEDHHLNLKCNKSRFKLLGMPPEEFPQEPEMPDEKVLALRDDFLKSLAKVKHAISRDVNRHNLNGVFWGKEVVATDGHRLSLAKKDYPLKKIIIPLEFVNLILKMRKDEDQKELKLCSSENMIFVYTDDFVFYSRLLDAEFPDYSKIVPANHQKSPCMDKVSLSQAIKRILLMSEVDHRIRFEFNGNSLLLASTVPNVGEASEEIEVVYESSLPDDNGKPFIVSFNGRYLLDILEILEDDNVTFLIHNDISPLKIEERDCVHLVMPLHLPDS